MLAAEYFDEIVAFLRRIGLTVHVGPFGRDGFLPGIRIESGVLWVDPANLHVSGDLLHEAGHLAILPSRYRQRIGEDVTASLEAVLRDDPDPAPEATRALVSGEGMALVWSYAALKALGLPLAAIFFAGGYHIPDERHADLAALIESGNYPGLVHLVALGMTGPCGISALLASNELPPFPAMTRWVLP